MVVVRQVTHMMSAPMMVDGLNRHTIRSWLPGKMFMVSSTATSTLDDLPTVIIHGVLMHACGMHVSDPLGQRL